MNRESQPIYIMAALAFLQGVLFLRFAIANSQSTSEATLKNLTDASAQIRIEHADENRERTWAPARYAVSAVGFGMAAALLMHFITPTVAYAILCLALVGRCVADQIVEERTPRRRAAVIGRPRSIDPVLVTWIALTGATSLVPIPWLLNHPYRIAAMIVIVCVLTMVVIAWRIASAPPLLFGSDLEAEQVVDRETRAIRTGNTCVLAVGTVGVFVAFVGGVQGFIDDHLVVWAVMLLWLALVAWKSIYARRLSQTPLAS